MPTLLRIGGYRFFFFSLENQEPPHIHVEQAERYAKIWLDPMIISRSSGFRSDELSEITRIVRENRGMFEDRSNEYFNRSV